MTTDDREKLERALDESVAPPWPLLVCAYLLALALIEQCLH